jgi:hypothetical protein
MLDRLLKPNMARGGGLDLFLLAVSGLWIFGAMGEMIYFSLKPASYPYGGPGFVDGAGGWISTAVSIVAGILLVAIFAASLCRVIYRAKHHD